MNETKKSLEDLKTEIVGLKIRLKRLEEFLLSFPDPKDYIHEDNSPDELLEEAKKVIRQYNKVSSSFIQRKLSISFVRAARIIDELEEEGVIGPAEGSKPREVFKKDHKKS